MHRKIVSLSILTLLLAASSAQAANDKDGDVVAQCTNKEHTYLFHADVKGNIKSMTLAKAAKGQWEYPCEPSHKHGEEVLCANEVYESGDVMSLYTNGTAVMHYNDDNDSNNDGPVAHCTGSYFK